MNYLLTEEEYKALVNAGKERTKAASDTLQDLCTKVATHMPITFWGRTEASPWGCILNKDDDKNMSYCDECPVRDVCPQDWKRWSK